MENVLKVAVGLTVVGACTIGIKAYGALCYMQGSIDASKVFIDSKLKEKRKEKEES